MHRRAAFVCALAIMAMATVARAQGAVATAVSCPGLVAVAGKSLGDPKARITQAVLVPAGQQAAGVSGAGGASKSAIPAHCEVFGTIAERKGANGQNYAIRFHMRLPIGWNGGLFFQGGGGSNGVVGAAYGNLMGAQPHTALSLGYAVVSQDSGHDNDANNDPQLQGTSTFGWDPEARRNYGFASIGSVTTVAKALIRSFYGKPPVRSYFVGGSKGGQEAFMAAQRFGAEYDGILAGYPGFRLATAGAVGEMWDDQAFAAAARAAGAFGQDRLPLLNKSFSDEDLALVSRSVLDACDALDGLRDGMIFAFTRCTTPRVLPYLRRITCKAGKSAACLAPAQVTALVRVFDGARGPNGKLLYATWPWDTGIGGRNPAGYYTGWRQWKIGRYDAAKNSAINVTLAASSVSAVFTSPPTPVASDPTDQTRYALGLDIVAADAASRVKWGPFHESSVDFMNADRHDLSAFSSHGGKLLIYHGVSDPVFSINDTITWWNAVDRVEKGKAARFTRLFAVPGMNHGGGGPAADQADFFSALVAWVEQGKAPSTIIATAQAGTDWPGRTRLLCAYPAYARFKGGDPESARSFVCR